MINPDVEQLLTIDEIVATDKRLQTQPGRKVHRNTLRRWHRFGVHGVKLEIYKVGTKVCTTYEAVGRFLAALNSEPGQPAPVNQNAAAAAGKQLEMAGA